MTSNIYLTPSFKRAMKKLKKRYPRIQNDVRIGVELLESQPVLGNVIPESDGIRKIRLPNSDAKRGKTCKRTLSALVRRVEVDQS